MDKFLSKDRKVILKSAATGVGIIAVLSLVFITESMFLWGLAFFVILATYWYIPTWFSKTRQLEKRAMACSPFKDSTTYGPTLPEYKYFNPEGIEVRYFSNKEKEICVILLFAISAFLVFVAYDPLIKLLISCFPILEMTTIKIAVIIYLSTPYLVRHIFCFTLNQPMDTSLNFLATYSQSSNANSPYVHKFNNSFRNTATSPSYSFLSYNMYYRR